MSMSLKFASLVPFCESAQQFKVTIYFPNIVANGLKELCWLVFQLLEYGPGSRSSTDSCYEKYLGWLICITIWCDSSSFFLFFSLERWLVCWLITFLLKFIFLSYHLFNIGRSHIYYLLVQIAENKFTVLYRNLCKSSLMPLMAPIPFCCLGMLHHSFDTALLLFLVCIFSCDLACSLRRFI